MSERERAYAPAFGAQLRYLVHVARPQAAVVGCLQFSSAAWRIAVRDHWIGWDEPRRGENLSGVVQQSRFLLLPWVRASSEATCWSTQATKNRWRV